MPDKTIGYLRQVGLAGGVDLKTASIGEVKPNARAVVNLELPEGVPPGLFSNLATEWELLERGVALAGLRFDGDGRIQGILFNLSNKRFAWDAGTKVGSMSLEAPKILSIQEVKLAPAVSACPPATETPEPEPQGDQEPVRPNLSWKTMDLPNGLVYAFAPTNVDGAGSTGYCMAVEPTAADLVDTPMGEQLPRKRFESEIPGEAFEKAKEFCEGVEGMLSGDDK